MRSVNSPTERVITTAYACSIGWEQLNSSLTSSSGTRDREEVQDVSVSFTPLTVQTAHWSTGSSVDTFTVEPASGRTDFCRHSEGKRIRGGEMGKFSYICSSVANWSMLRHIFIFGLESLDIAQTLALINWKWNKQKRNLQQDNYVCDL